MSATRFTTQTKKIMVVVTAGGYTNAAPLFEIAAILASRGYNVEFATLDGRQKWLTDRPFISCTHVLGPDVTPELEEKNYLSMSTWSSDITTSWNIIFGARMFLESTWPQAYNGLRRLVANPDTRPSLILADYLVDAARDISREYDIPLAMHWPQMPTAMLRASYIPGTPGLQIDVLTSEFASIWQRLKSGFAIYTSLPHYLRYLRWSRSMRASQGVKRPLPALDKPDYLCLVNSFFGLEAAKDLPPNVAAIGPILPDTAPTLTEPYVTFLATRRKVLYISMGTHVLLPERTILCLLAGAVAALDDGVVDGIIWPLNSKARKQLNPSAQLHRSVEGRSLSPSTKGTTVGSLLSNSHESILFAEFAPQRTLLEDSRVAAFISHLGASSVNEALYAGVPLITLPGYFDQIQNGMRLRDAGVSVPLQKETIDEQKVRIAISRVLDDMDRGGPISLNVRRMQGIARIAARRKHLGADLIEEHIVDWEFRQHEQSLGGQKQRGMHLQTADARMPKWKARNWDLCMIIGAATFFLGGIVVVAVTISEVSSSPADLHAILISNQIYASQKVFLLQAKNSTSGREFHFRILGEYEFYYDVVLGGQYTFHISKLHAKYGPVVRINPNELHVNDPNFYDELYAGGGRRRHKWYWASRAFGADMSTFATELHDVHRMRRSTLNPFFSMTRVRQLEGRIQNRVNVFLERVEEARGDGRVLRLDVAFGAYSADVIMEYAFGQASRKIEAPDFDNDFHEACVNGGKQLFLTRHFPILLKLVKAVPPHLMLKFNPAMTSFFAMHKDIGTLAKTLYNESPGARLQDGRPTVFHEILDSKLPEEEKTLQRLATDGGALVGAGTVTTAWAITVAVFYLLHHPHCLKEVKHELISAVPGVTAEEQNNKLPTLEKLPYLSAVIQEALRLSYGVASRLARIAPDETLKVADDDGGTGREWLIPPGTPVSMTQLLLFRDERVFPSPFQFRPERWIEDPKLSRFQVAFSKGSRICLGKNLAIAEMYLMLAALFRFYGSRVVRMPEDVGFIELWDTDESDVECSVDAFIPLPKAESKGVRCKVYKWD
ncbi:hypothetical protein DL768_002203 [Monosporascus sp. mg162]|nr:hypothetical protein DL768_002203 [Monosporascus sp. mg162]